MEDLAHRLLAAVDRKDMEQFLSFIAEDASFRFGSAPPVAVIAHRFWQERYAGDPDIWQKITGGADDYLKIHVEGRDYTPPEVSAMTMSGKRFWSSSIQ